MTYPNPYYDPDWKTEHDRHDEERTRARLKMDRLAKAGEMDSEDYSQAEADFDRHHAAACHALLKKQHPTVQKYAEWLFREFRVDSKDCGAGIPVPEVDFEELRTVDEVDAAWQRLHTAIKNSAYEKRAGLPIGQPQGLKAFADPASPGLMRFWRHFDPSELYPGRYARGTGVRTLITVDQQDGWHVCFMQDWNSPDAPVTHMIAELASVIYREACATAEQSAPASGFSGWLAHRVAWRAPAAVPDPWRFHFHQHIPPNPQGCRETFERVALGFEGGKYRKPGWSRYPVIPKVIQSARLECAVENPPLGRQVALLP
jgi:hypothetical protein